MKGQTAQIILVTIYIECSLCTGKRKEKFRHRYVLFKHLCREHTDIEGEKFLKIKRIRF